MKKQGRMRLLSHRCSKVFGRNEEEACPLTVNIRTDEKAQVGVDYMPRIGKYDRFLIVYGHTDKPFNC